MHGLRAPRVLHLRGPAAVRVLYGCSEKRPEEHHEPGSTVHRLQPPRLLEPAVQNLPDMPRSDVPRRRSVLRGHPAAAGEAAAEVHGREAAVLVRALPVPPMPEMPEGNAQRDQVTVYGEREGGVDVRGLSDSRGEPESSREIQVTVSMTMLSPEHSCRPVYPQGLVVRASVRFMILLAAFLPSSPGARPPARPAAHRVPTDRSTLWFGQ